MVLLITLLNNQLKELLRENALDTQGNKAEMVERLSEYYGTNEIDKSTIDRLFPSPDAILQDQITSLKDVMQTLVQTVEQIKSVMPNTTTSATVPPTTNTVPVEEVRSIIDNDDVQSNEDVNYAMVQNGSNLEREYQHRYSVKEIGDTIPEFDPTKETSLSVEQFVQHIEGARTAYGWNERALLLAVYGRLRGVARMWYDGRQTVFTNWYSFKTEILREFATCLNEAEISKKMRQTTRKIDEGVIDYCFRINAIGTRYNLSEAAIIRYARDGIKHRELQNSLLPLKFTSMKQFRETIAEYLSNISSQSYKQASTVVVKPEKREQLPLQNQKKDVRCFNCNVTKCN